MSQRGRNRDASPTERFAPTLTRRDFVLTGTAAGVAAATGLGFGASDELEFADLAVAHGADVERNTTSVIDAMVGISQLRTATWPSKAP